LIRNRRFREWSADAQPDGYPDQIVLRTLDQKAAVDAVPKGTADIGLRVTMRLSKAQVAALAARYSSLLRTSTNPQTISFFLNTRIPPFDDVRARRAVNFAFDRTAYAQLLGIDAEPTCQLLPPNSPSFQRFCPYVPNGVAGLDKARRLVRASGTAGQSVRVWVPAPRAPSGRFMVSVLRSIGYAAHLKVFAPNVDYFPLVLQARSRAQVGFDGWISDFPSESGFLTIQFACAGKPQYTNDPSFFCDHRIDRLMAHAADVEAVNPAAAHVLWHRVEQALLAEAPVVPTENTKNVDMVAKRVGNYQYHPQWGALLDQLWLR
jgi:peptide/nickel transport system substrate-binding protein